MDALSFEAFLRACSEILAIVADALLEMVPFLGPI